MKLIPDWWEVLTKAWSPRWIGLSFLCDVLGIVFAGWGMFSGSLMPFIVLSVIGAAFGLIAFVARVLPQRSMGDA